MQVINRQPVEGSFGESFDRNMQQIVGLKMQDLLQKHQGRQFQKLVPGMSPEKAQAFAALPPLAQKEFIKSGLLAALQGGQQPQVQQSELSQILGQQQPQVQQVQPEQKALQKLSQQSQPDFGPQATLKRAMAAGMSPEQQYQLAQQVQAPELQTQQQAPTRQMQPQVAQQQQAQPAQQVKPTDMLKQQLQQTLTSPLIPINQKAAASRQLASIEKEERKEAHQIHKEVMPVHKKLVEEYKGALDDDRRLNRMKELVDKGNLTRPRWHSILNGLEHGLFGLGVNLHSLETADSQEFDKLSKEFLKNAKNVFGSRITDNDVRVFLKMVPDLSQNREGKLAIIDNMKSYNQGIKIRKQASDIVLRSNNGKFPIDYEEQIEKIAGPQLDELSKKFATAERTKPKIPVKSLWENIQAQDPLNILFGEG